MLHAQKVNRFMKKTDFGKKQTRKFLSSEFSTEIVFVRSPYYTTCSAHYLLPLEMSHQVSQIT